VQKRPHPYRRLPRRLPFFACLASASLILFALTPAHADEAACPGELVAAFDANGATLAFPRGVAGAPLDILAIGSSSTEGVGASSPANAYPARLEAELEKRTGVDFDVKNAGVGGELAAKTLERLKNALNSGWAKLVIWQVGTNDAIAGVNEALFRATVESGVAAARAAHVPLVLIDPQFTLACPDVARYERYVAMSMGLAPKTMSRS
jgi:acyl-CoA thioesterase I